MFNETSQCMMGSRVEYHARVYVTVVQHESVRDDMASVGHKLAGLKYHNWVGI